MAGRQQTAPPQQRRSKDATAVGALYSSPESRLTVITYMRGLSRLATAHLLLLEPVLKFVSIYVLVIILERKKATDLVGG